MSIADDLKRGLDLHQKGQLAEAGEVYRDILKKDPDNVDALNLLGVILQAAGELETAIVLLERATVLAPDYAAPYVNLGNALQLARRAEDAVDAFEKAIALDPEQPAAANNLASVLNDLGRHEEALDACVVALKKAPDFGEAHNNMGNALAALGRADDAEKSYRRALEINPAHATAYFNLGNVLADGDRLDDALEAYRKAVALDAANAEKHYNYANTALKLDRFEDAVASFERAIEIDEEYLDAYCNMGSALQSLGRVDEAIQSYRRALALAAEEDDATDLHWNLSLALLQNGDYEEGWREYDWRWRTPTFAKFQRDWEKPEWVGEALAGETVLVHAEQGFGDAIQFCRFAPMVAARGGRVVLESRKELTRLFGTLEGVNEGIDLGQPVPEHDFQVPLMTLPRVFGTTLKTVPADVPYLAVPDGARPDPRIEEATGLKVGFAWAGSPTRRDNIKRSAPLADFAPLFRVPGATFFSLQVGPFRPELDDLDEGLGVIDLAGGLEDFGDTAAQVQAMDLVISVDTALLHVAGALAKPAWGLMSRPTGFLWMDERPDSPWYPTARLFRQPEPGAWAPVFEAVETELAGLAKKKG